MRRAAATAAVVLLAGCTGGDGDDPASGPTGTVPTSAEATTTPAEPEAASAPEATSAPGATDTPTGSGTTAEETSDDPTEETAEEADDPTEEPGTSGDGPTRTGSPQALPPWTDDAREQVPGQGAADGAQEITGVRTGLHEDFDRVVLDLTGDDPVLGWFAGLTDQAVQDASGLPMDVEGQTFLQVNVRGIDWTTESPDRYDGATVTGAGTAVLTEVVFGVLFEGQQQVVLGLREETDYRIFSLSDPARIVVDLRHP